MPPKYVDETTDQYTDRLTGADRTDRRPYDHNRYRQCSIGWHDECSATRTDDTGPGGCECPHHTDPDYKTLDEQERDMRIAVAERLIKDSIYAARNAGRTVDDAAHAAAVEVVDVLFDEDDE
jgi:hypothetical protein